MLCSGAKCAKIADMSGYGEAHYQRMASIQQSMHQREKRRLQLERELFACSRSDKRVSQIKRSKLHSYLKEICDREARAKIRNLELLRDVECIEIGMKEYSPDHGPLQQQKDEFFRKIANFTEAMGKVERTHVATESKVKGAKDSAKEPVQPPAIGHCQQTSTESGADASATSVHSRRALHRSPDRSQYSGKHPPSGLLKDFRAGGGDAASDRARLSDDISGSNDSPDGSNLSDKHERTTARLPSVPAAGGAPFGSRDGQRLSPLVTLTGPEMNRSPRSSGGPAKAVKDISAAHVEACEVAPQTPVTEGEEKVVGHLMPETATGIEAQHTPGMCGDDGTADSDVELSDSSESDQSLSLTQSELEEDEEEEEEEEAEAAAPEAPERSATSRASDRSWHSPESASGSDVSPQPSHQSSAPVEDLERLSQEGLFHLLDSIEGRLRREKAVVYGNSSADCSQLNRIISLCNRRAGMTDEDLEACGAVVLRGLQRLSWSTTQGCVLPRELVDAHQATTEPNGISASLTPDAARLWDRWFKHALLLKERRLLSAEHLVQLFTPLLLERHAAYGHQAKVLLRTLVSRSSEEGPSAEDRSDSASSPGAAEEEASRPTQELQSSEEDSQDESPVESVPIRETKAYQLLKQSAMQERLPSSEEEEEEEDAALSGINHWRDEDLGRAKRSSHQDPYPRTNAASSKSRSAPRSKAFLRDSDESNSDIEAALRPQPLRTNADDFDDFAD